MIIIDYILGFLVALYRILVSILKQIIETPMACHYLGRLCAEESKTPWQLTQKEIDDAFKAHLEL